jgi:hypothetical protein
MAWVTGFKHDIFISYAWVDNQVAEGDPEEKGWVARFHKELLVELGKKVGRMNVVKIWRDTQQIAGNQLFDRTVHDAVQGSAVFLALDSPGYLASECCGQELQSFFEKSRKDPAGLAVGDKYRIFHLLLNNLPTSLWPNQMGRTPAFPFHDKDGGDPVGPGSKRFISCIQQLARALHGTLEGLKQFDQTKPFPPVQNQPRSSTLFAETSDTQRSEKRKVLAELENQPRFSIFFAETSDTLRSKRTRALRDLAGFGDLNLISGVPPPFPSAEHDERVRQELRSADLSVHLLDNYPGRPIGDEEGSTYPQRQVELAIEHGKPQLIWVPKSMQYDSIEEEEYETFLRQLENGPRSDCSYDFQRELPDAIPRLIRTKVDEIKSRRRAPAAPLDAVLLDTHVKDQLFAVKLSNYLVDHGMQAYINPGEDNPIANLAEFTERLKQAGVLILIYGAVAEEWMRNRLAETLRIVIAEQCPLRVCGVYVAPPHKASQPILKLPLVSVEWMDHTGGFNSGAIDHLLNRARAARA